MNILDNVQQGSEDWHTIRAQYFCASEAPAMLGLSKYTTRTELLREKATGYRPEVDAFKQKLFDAGHAAEVKARLIAEKIHGEEFYPVVGTAEIERLKLLASFDGLDMEETTVFESKLWNDALGESIRKQIVPDTHWPQLEHQLLVSGAKRVMFMVSDGTFEKTVWTEYRSILERRAQLIAGWKQFAEDLKTYQHQEVIPAAVAAPIEDLPALTVELVGEVRKTNLASWKANVLARIDDINTDLQTDNDFATAEKTVKFLDDGEKKLDLVKSQALAQTATIDDLFRTIDALKETMRAKRLTLDKLVKARKESIRGEIIQAGRAALSEHIAGLNTRIGHKYMPVIDADFVGAVKGKKSVASVRDAVDSVLVNAKLEANAVADRIQVNLNSFMELSGGKSFLFPDIISLAQKANDDFVAAVKTRIGDHVIAEAKRQEAEHEKMAAEGWQRINSESTTEVTTEVKAEPAKITITHISPAETLRYKINHAVLRMNEADLRKTLLFIEDIIRIAA